MTKTSKTRSRAGNGLACMVRLRKPQRYDTGLTNWLMTNCSDWHAVITLSREVIAISFERATDAQHFRTVYQ